MKRYFQYFFAYISILSIWGCTSSEDSKNQVALIYSNDINIPLDTTTTPYTMCAQLVSKENSSEEILYMLNENNNSVQGYNVSTGEKTKNYFFCKEGPFGVGKINGFFVDNMHNMYVVNRESQVLYKVSLQGTPIKKYKLNQATEKNIICPIPNVGDGVETGIYESEISLPGNPALVHDVNPEAFFKESHLAILIDTTSGVVRYDINYPNADLLIKNNYPPQSIMPFCVSGEKAKFIYSFGCDHKVYLFDKTGKYIRSYTLNSKHAPDNIKPMSPSVKYADAEDCYIHYVNNLYYGALHYDKYRKKYYRLVKKPSKFEYTKNDLKNGKVIEQQWSIIIADENFDKLSEFDLPNEVWGGLVLVSKEGLLFQKTINSEDNMTFSVFKILEEKP